MYELFIALTDFYACILSDKSSVYLLIGLTCLYFSTQIRKQKASTFQKVLICLLSSLLSPDPETTIFWLLSPQICFWHSLAVYVNSLESQFVKLHPYYQEFMSPILACTLGWSSSLLSTLKLSGFLVEHCVYSVHMHRICWLPQVADTLQGQIFPSDCDTCCGILI